MDSIERLQGLYADLQAFAETRLANIDRLWQELEDSVQEFRKLLDKPTAATTDRDAYNAGEIASSAREKRRLTWRVGKITVGDQDFSINDEFKHVSRAVGTALDLDEVEAGRLLIQSHGNLVSGEESLIADAVGTFHDRRDLLLQTLRIILQESLNLDSDETTRQAFRETVAQILDVKSGPPSNGSAFAAKCMGAMDDTEKWQAKIADQLQSKAVLGEPRGPEFYATLEFQRDSLFKQHEALGCILAYLFRGNYTISEDLRKLNNVVRRWDRLDLYLIHYLPAFSAAFRQYGSPEGSTSQDGAKTLDGAFRSLKQDVVPSLLRPFKAVLDLWWVVEYSGWFRDPTDQDRGADARAEKAKAALEENALEFLLSIATSSKIDVWRHPARREMVALLLHESSGLAVEGDQTSSYFRLMFMECLEAFAEAWITNMPDSIRRLKNEEDDRRLDYIVAVQEGLHPNAPREPGGPLHFESFLLLLSFAFEQRPAAAEQWWDDPDSNLYGFLQWASRRQTVPRVSAFCEMLCSISEGPECAVAAHKFLLNESIPAATPRSRRIPSMNYHQMFAELDLYAHKVHERSPASQVPSVRKVLPTDMNELESPVMLACYLRLLAHLARQHDVPRKYILSNSTTDLPRTLLLLSSGPVPSYLRASAFSTIETLLTDKEWEIASTLWKILDAWTSNSHDVLQSALVKTNQSPEPSMGALQNTLTSIAISFDQYDAFVMLLRTLTTMNLNLELESQLLPFPADLGSSYRSPGIMPYVDFVCGQIFVKRLRELGDDSQAVMCSFHCLDFVAVGLEGFNENYVAMLDRSAGQQQGLPESPVSGYAQRHPFSRLMEWLLSVDMNKAVMETLHVPIDTVEAALPDSPLVLNLQRAIDVVNLVLDLQPTYLDIVRPLLRDRTEQERPFLGASVSSIEDSIAAHPDLVLDLCRYATTDHSELALRALALLQKLSSSPKLNDHFLAREAVRGRSRRVIDMVGSSGSSELAPVVERLSKRLQIDVRELEDGVEAPGYLIKDGILAFLNACLKAQLELPNIAHLLLGFDRIGDHLIISDSIDNGTSVFNAIVDLVQDYPDGENGAIESWLIHLKAAGMQVLRHLWSSTASRGLVINQFRRLRFLQTLFASLSTPSQDTIWDGNGVQQPQFWTSTSAEALTEFLAFRAALCAYIAKEIHAAAAERLNTTLKHILSTLQGRSTNLDGSSITHPDVVTFFDLLDLDLAATPQMPTLEFFGRLEFDSYKTEASDDRPSLYDIGMIRELLQTYQADLLFQQARQVAGKPLDQDRLTLEADAVLGLLEARNRWTLAQKARAEALHQYVEMIVATIEYCPMDPVAKSQFILRLLQLILPKLDSFILDESENTIELAKAADAFLFALSETSQTTPGRIDGIVTEKLFQLFRTCIDGIPMSNSSVALRATLYSISTQYLSRITAPDTFDSDICRRARSNSLDCVRSASMRLINVLCDDAEDGLDACRLNALNLLALLTSLARSEKSPFVLHALLRGNLLAIFIDPLKTVVAEFQESEPTRKTRICDEKPTQLANPFTDRPYLLSIFEARMLLLLQISRTRDGATAMLDAGLMSAIRDSMIFRADPDLGISLSPDSANTPESVSSALRHYYTLTASTLRVLLSTFSSRGGQNEQVQFLARTFLQDYRANMVGLFKKYLGVNGKVDEKCQPALAECVKCYAGLATLCGYVEVSYIVPPVPPHHSL